MSRSRSDVGKTTVSMLTDPLPLAWPLMLTAASIVVLQRSEATQALAVARAMVRRFSDTLIRQVTLSDYRRLGDLMTTRQSLSRCARIRKERKCFSMAWHQGATEGCAHADGHSQDFSFTRHDLVALDSLRGCASHCPAMGKSTPCHASGKFTETQTLRVGGTPTLRPGERFVSLILGTRCL